MKLVQHYQRVHGRREFVCGKCGKQFGLRDVCQRHEVECGQSFTCGTCTEKFRSKNALYQHTKRKHRTLPPGSRNRLCVSSVTGDRLLLLLVSLFDSRRCGRTPAVVVPLVLKQVVQIPRDGHDKHHKPHTVDVASQTEPEPQSVGLLEPTQTRTVIVAPGALTLDHSDLATQTDIGSQLLNFSTQTMNLTSTQACQTQSLASCELGTQTYMDLTSQFTQTGRDPTPQLYSDPAIQFSLGTQTYLDSTSQFGQTQHDPTTEFGLSPQLSDPSSQFGLCDFGTQTVNGLSLVEQVLGSSLLPPECLDFGTQTQESALEEMACIDFRELLHSRTREQSSQT